MAINARNVQVEVLGIKINRTKKAYIKIRTGKKNETWKYENLITIITSYRRIDKEIINKPKKV